MNKKLVVSLCILSGLFLGSLKSFAAEPVKAPAGAKFAVVEVSVVVANSKKVATLQKEQEKKMQDLKKWLETVRADVSKQSTQTAKDKLIKKYDAEFAKKQEALKKDYAQKLQAIDNEISAIVAKEAKAKNYDMVFAKGTVLFGGDDITPVIVKAVK